MSYIEYDSSIITFGDAELILRHQEKEIAKFSIPAPKLGEKYRESINTEYFWFNYNNIEYEVEISSSNVGTYISVDSDIDSKDIDEFEIIIDRKDAFYTDESNSLEMPVYVPVLPFTSTTSSVLFGLANEKVIPFLDFETIDKFQSYLEDDLIDFKHFIDISSIKDMENREQREDAKKKRKEERKLYGNGNAKTLIPDAIHKFVSYDEKINILNRISAEKSSIAIPVFKWEKEMATTNKLKMFIKDLSLDYQDIALRVSSLRAFTDNIEDISKIANDCYLILDLNTNFDKEKIKELIKDIQEYSFKRIIYLGAQFNAEDISIKEPDTNTNLTATNQPLKIYESIYFDKELTDTIGYGDYCGFDRKTITEMPSGGRPTARVVLESLDDSMKVLVRRGWSEDDVTRDPFTNRIKRLGYKQSMKRLLCDIQKGELDKVRNALFMDKELCDADYSLKDFCPDITTPGVVKTLCLRHNVFSIIHNYIND